jgi:CubicO group peptidase (beta-lactamase class C family)
VALLQLWERGLFDLDADVDAFLPFAVRNPRYPDASITFRQTLTHQSSLADGPAYLASYACGDPALPLGAWLESYLSPAGASYAPDDNFHPFEPGSRFAYSNIGFGLAGYLVETIGGRPFHHYCRDNIFAPLAMPHTAYHLADLDLTQHALPYTTGDSDFLQALRPEGSQPSSLDDPYPLCLYSFPNLPDGLVRTSVHQLARFLSCILNGGTLDGAQLLQTATVERLLTAELRNPFGAGTRLGLGWMALPFRGAHVWGHSGGDPGVSTQMWFSPETNVGAIVFANAEVRLEDSVERLLTAAEDW